jgi:hypothetical protein
VPYLWVGGGDNLAYFVGMPVNNERAWGGGGGGWGGRGELQRISKKFVKRQGLHQCR